MIAIVTIAGQQFKVTEGQELFVHQLEATAGSSVSFDQVLMTDNNGTVRVGTPVLSNAKVNATVIGKQKGDKVIVFKKKRRKGYQKKNGHRQSLTQIQITGITGFDAKKEEKDLTDASAKLLEDYKKLVVTGVKTEAPHEDVAPVMPKTLDECADEVLNKESNK